MGSGSHIRSSVDKLNRFLIASDVLKTDSCVNIQPFGSEVVPEVNIMSAGSLAMTSSCRASNCAGVAKVCSARKSEKAVKPAWSKASSDTTRSSIGAEDTDTAPLASAFANSGSASSNLAACGTASFWPTNIHLRSQCVAACCNS